jgi:nitroreductase
MDFRELVRSRRSCRAFDPRPVDRELLAQCLEAARLAPSACNSQPWHFVVVDEPALRERLARATTSALLTLNRFVSQAPVLVAIVSERAKLVAKIGGAIKGKPYSLMDVGIAAEHFCLQATELGLGACMLGWFDERSAKRLLGVPRGKRVELLIAVGHPREQNSLPGPRKPLDEMSSWNAYGVPRSRRAPE